MSEMLRRVVMMMNKNIAVTYATWNPSDKSANISLSGGDLTATQSTTTTGLVRSTIGKSSGKWYWEVTWSSGPHSLLPGITKSAVDTSSYPGSVTDGWGYWSTNGNLANSGGNIAYGASYTTGTIIGCALDMDAGTFTMYKNNVSQGTAVTGLSGDVYAAVGGSSGAGSRVSVANFGATSFTYSPPGGYNAGLYT